jgi:molybdenum cofactor cytidylyltransferase
MVSLMRSDIRRKPLLLRVLDIAVDPGCHLSSGSGIFRNMERAPSFAGVILAAGESSRMGRDKALLPWPPMAPGQSAGQTFLSTAIASLALSTDFVVVVAGKNLATLEPVVYANGATLVHNPDPSRGQFSSLQLGLETVLTRGRDSAIVTLVDRPPASPDTVRVLRRGFESAPLGVWAVVPEFAGKHGHPYVIGREMIERFLEAPADANAREIEHRYQDRIQYLAVEDRFVAFNINTPEDYAGLSTL